jgi:dUTP pyrophosphatase
MTLSGAVTAVWRARMADSSDNDVTLKVRLVREGAQLPRRASDGAAGYDLFASIAGLAAVDLSSDPMLIPTGIAIELPPGYEAQVRPRSGLAMQGVMVALGTIDADYRGEVLVTMYVYGSRQTFGVRNGDRIAQLVINRLPNVTVQQVDTLSDTDRGSGGFGSTGVQ